MEGAFRKDCIVTGRVPGRIGKNRRKRRSARENGTPGSKRFKGHLIKTSCFACVKHQRSREIPLCQRRDGKPPEKADRHTSSKTSKTCHFCLVSIRKRRAGNPQLRLYPFFKDRVQDRNSDIVAFDVSKTPDRHEGGRRRFCAMPRETGSWYAVSDNALLFCAYAHTLR